ncbi:FtsK/SpoIIIE domain-containing protein [Nonomuraea dietziae]|uniref:FtsK/SpoIIIE domain-containing protein n=1 Tax=Nonomuraea dietziae TaxID=65515 RepID=UPI003409FFE7
MRAVRDALVEIAAGSAQHRRLYLREHFGISPAEVYRELQPLLNSEVRVGPGDGTLTRPIAAIRRANVLIIPYLVDEAGTAGANHGLRGYAGTLRTDFAQTAALGDVHVLLVLDPEPFETILTAAEDAGRLEQLSWARLVRRIGQTGAGPAQEVIGMVAEHLAGYRTSRSRQYLDAFADFAGRAWSSAREAGLALPSIGCYVADPTPNPLRLEQGASWRRDLDLWSLPDRDLAAELTRHAGGMEEGVQRIVLARSPFGLDYNKFAFDDLPTRRQKERGSIVQPAQIHGVLAALSADDVAVIWLEPDEEGFSLAVTGNVQRARPKASWHDGSSLTCTVDEGRMLLHVAVPGVGEEGWWFGVVSIRPGNSMRIGAYRGQGPWFPVERSLSLDTSTGCFRAVESASVLAVAQGGRVLGEATIGEFSTETEEQQVVTATYGEARCRVPIMIESLHQPPIDVWPPDEPGDPREDDDGDDEPPGPPWDDGDETDNSHPRTRTSVASGAHALLALAGDRQRDGALPPKALPTFNAGDTPSFTVDSAWYDLERQHLARDLDGLACEQQILRMGKAGEALAFTLVRAGDGKLEIAADPVLNQLRLDTLDKAAMQHFFAARREFFTEVESVGTIHALLCGMATSTGRAYVDAYQALLETIEFPARYTPELDRLLLVDLMSSEDSSECWLAPTNPVTVAWMLELWEQLPGWAAQGGLPPRDVKALLPRYLLPLMYAHGSWWEVDDRSPLLWRHYRPLGSSLTVGGSNQRTITRRIEKFLQVFHAYNDPRQRLALSFREPGDGGSVADALRSFYQEELAPGAEPSRPSLDVTVYTEDGRVPEKLAALMAPDSERDIDRLVRSRVRLSMQRNGDEPVFAHLCFIFRSPAAREPRLVRIDERCPTNWAGSLAAAAGRTAAHNPNEMTFSTGLFVRGDQQAGLPGLLQKTLELVGAQPRGYLQRGLTQAITTAVSAELLDRVQKNSVWTVHADRLLGLEAFSPDLIGRKVYIVDFEDRTSLWQAGLDSITVTERVDPYRTALSRAFAPAARLHAEAIPQLIDSANAVSGRWNLDLLSLPINMLRERIGLLMAIAVLRDLDRAFVTGQRAGSDAGGVLLPLDELFRLLPASGLPRPSGRSCDDLLYLRLHHEGDVVRIAGRLIEVKYTSIGQPDLGNARRELERTREWLSTAINARTAARPFRSRDLAEFIRAGAIRNRSFGLGNIDPEHIEGLAAAIARGDYELDLSFRAGDDGLCGDVISLELENPVPARRMLLPGEGLPFGYLRLGAPLLERLASGENLPLPASWAPISFPQADGRKQADARVPAREEGTGSGSPPPDPVNNLVQQAADAPSTEGDQPRSGLPSDPSTATPPISQEVRAKSAELDAACAKYGLQLAPFDMGLAQVGPSVIRLRTRLLGKESISNVRKRALDLGREVGVAEGLLIDQEPYYLTVDVPRAERVVVKLADHISALERITAPGALPFLSGMEPSGEARIEDLARLPHLLVAGATGSGKSVLLRGLLCCLVRTRSPQQLQLLVVDPKQVDFRPFQDLRHLVGGRIVTDPVEAVSVLQETLQREVTWRREKLAAAGVSSAIEFYESGGSLEDLPQMVILVDEFSDLADSLDRAARDNFMTLIRRFGQLTRAFGIYLVLATQRPSVQVITGDIKANLTARIALKVQSAVDSTTILGRGGAEALRDQGDMIFDHGGRSRRLQGFYAGPADVRDAKSRWTAG